MLDKLLSRFGKPFYLKTQGYKVSYITEIKNSSDKTIRSFLLLPVVQNTASQTLVTKASLDPSAVIQTDPQFHNQYAQWEFSIAPGEEKTFKQLFQIKVEPQEKKSVRFSLADYKKLDPQIFKLYTSASKHLESSSGEILELAAKIKGQDTDVLTLVKKINEYVISQLAYGNPIMGLYTSLEALEKKTVDCGGFDTLFVALSQAIGIPARLVSGFWAGYHKNDMHAWVEVVLPDGSLLPIDPSMEQLRQEGRTRKSGRLGFTGSDRIALSVGSDIELTINGQKLIVDILQNPIVHPENDALMIRRIFSTQPL